MLSSSVCGCLLGLGAVLLAVLSPAAAGSCQAFRKCCPGKNITCRQEVTDETSILNGKKYCYCDAYCKAAGDCCSDYSAFCRAVDCEVGPWSDWGDCSKDCGFGQRKRHRDEVIRAENAGLKCPRLDQQRWCMGLKCARRRGSDDIARGETAKIVHAKFADLRDTKEYNPWKGIRKNLFFQYKKDEVVDRPAYCAEFEIRRTRKACGDKSEIPWVKYLKKGNTVCVECQPLAMKQALGVRCRGHGVMEEETHWYAVNSEGCHGKWIQKTKHAECSCNPAKESSFIFI